MLLLHIDVRYNFYVNMPGLPDRRLYHLGLLSSPKDYV